MDPDKLHDLAQSIKTYNKTASKRKSRSLTDRMDTAQGELASVLGNINRINQLSQTLSDALSAPLNQHCRAQSWQQGQLTILVDSPAWASKLRFEKSELMSYLRKNGFAGLTQVDIKVSPE